MKKLWNPSFIYAIIFWSVVMVILFIVMNSLVMPILAGRFTSLVKVPSLIGQSSEKAEALLEEQGLHVHWNPKGKYSAIQPAGFILIQNPPEGRKVKKGRRINLTISKGKRELAIPSLRGKSLRQAEITLNRMGLVQGKTIKGSHRSIPRGVVIRTVPPTGDTVRVGDKVNIVISAGKKPGSILLPRLTGLSLDQAQRMIDSLEFKIDSLIIQQDTARLPNTIIAQQPKSGEYLPIGTAIRLFVSK